MHLNWLKTLNIAITGAIAFYANNSVAQITPDATLPNNSNVSLEENTRVITGGTQAGSNLFHSFQDFSIPTGSEAFFNNSVDIQNIISRVTGGAISNIDGLITANGTANLFLINPNGIVFSENAQLNIGGSFVGTSADSLKFADGSEFSARNPQTTPLLSINIPVGLQFGADPGLIQVQGNGQQASESSITDTEANLQVQPEQTLALVGGEINLKGATLKTTSGRIELGSVDENSLVNLTSANTGWLLGYQDVTNFQNISLTDTTNLAVNGNGQGSIAINANNIDILSGSNIQAGIDSNFQFSGIQAEDITLNASGNITLDNSTIANEVYEQGIGNGGNVEITGRSLFLNNGAIISSNSFGQGNTGNIIINASDTFSYDGAGNSEETSISATLFGTGSGGQIAVNAPKISLLDAATIVSHSVGRGNAGKIEISASDNVLISDTNSGIGSQVFADAVGNGGTITINAPKLSLLNGATIVAHTNAQGNAGDITVNANEVFLDGSESNSSSGIGSAAFELASGNGGAIVINTDSLNVTNGATLLVSNFVAKDAGSVTINATGAVSFSGIGTNGYSSSAFSTVEAGSNGNGREIKITANSLTVENGAVIGASTSGQGRGGDINLDVNTLQVQGGGQILTTSRGSGDAGNISINTTENTTITGSDPTFPERLARIGRPIVRNEGAASGIFANTDVNSTGSGGNINISTQNLSISDNALINATNQGKGVAGNTGGNITLQIADNLSLRNSRISAQALNNADGGNINIDANFVIAFPNQNNDIIASAAQGNGGNIELFTNAIFGIEERGSTPINNTNDLDASSNFGLDGTVNINELDVNPTEGLEELPVEIIDVAGLVEQNLCQQGQGSEFIVTGKGGIAPSPNQAREGEISEVDLVEPTSLGTDEGSSVQNASIEKKAEIIEAQGWIINDRGIVELVAHKSNSSPSQPQGNNVCNTGISY
ncbi:MAG: filamentous hemagglutinin N-terminal domain-containing protein [Waterburya sp.]